MKLGTWADDECFYVDAVDGKRFVLLAGPFRTLPEAEALTDKVRNYAVDKSGDPKAIWYAYGCCKMANGYRTGRLNAALGLTI